MYQPPPGPHPSQAFPPATKNPCSCCCSTLTEGVRGLAIFLIVSHFAKKFQKNGYIATLLEMEIKQTRQEIRGARKCEKCAQFRSTATATGRRFLRLACLPGQTIYLQETAFPPLFPKRWLLIFPHWQPKIQQNRILSM